MLFLKVNKSAASLPASSHVPLKFTLYLSSKVGDILTSCFYHRHVYASVSANPASFTGDRAVCDFTGKSRGAKCMAPP